MGDTECIILGLGCDTRPHPLVQESDVDVWVGRVGRRSGTHGIVRARVAHF